MDLFDKSKLDKQGLICLELIECIKAGKPIEAFRNSVRQICKNLLYCKETVHTQRVKIRYLSRTLRARKRNDSRDKTE